jgi:hypothetical protein
VLNASDLCSKDIWLETWPGYWLRTFVVFSSPCRKMMIYYTKLGHYHFLSRSSQRTITQ